MVQIRASRPIQSLRFLGIFYIFAQNKTQGIGGFGAMGALPMFGFKAFELTNMKCLMDNRDKIKSKQCQISVDRRFKIRSKSISLAPALLSKCKGDVKMFCGDVKAGDGKILACLQVISRS